MYRGRRKQEFLTINFTQMRNVSFFSCLYVLAGLFTVISSCKKEHNESREVELTSSGLSVSKAHDWFEKNKSVALNLNKPGKSGSVTNFTPDWQNALNSEDVDYYIVECPAKFSKPTGFSIKKAMGKYKNVSKRDYKFVDSEE
jgi:hypothetical protein